MNRGSAGARAAIAGALMVFGGVFPVAAAEPTAATKSILADESYWHYEPPHHLIGVWARDGKCDNGSVEKLIFSSGGYRFSRDDGTWGVARGKFGYATPRSARILFRMQRMQPIEGYDAVISVNGTSMRKKNILSDTTVTYGWCDAAPPSPL